MQFLIIFYHYMNYNARDNELEQRFIVCLLSFLNRTLLF